MSTHVNWFGILRGAIGGVALAALSQGVVAVIAWSSPSPDANIGAGLLAFAVASVAALAWCGVESYRAGLTLGLIIAVVSAMTYAAATLAFLAAGAAADSESFVEALLLDLGLGGFLAGLVAGPGAVGAILGHSARSQRQ